MEPILAATEGIRMLFVSIALAALPAQGLGAAYPAATLEGAVEQQRCMTRYTISSADPLAKIASFYSYQAATAQVPLLGDSASKFSKYRTLVFVRQPRFLEMVLTRKNGRTMARVAYHLTMPPGCN